MSHIEIARQYISYLERGSIDEILTLFAEGALVHSPVYGRLPAPAFYRQLLNDTERSVLHINGIFEEDRGSRLAIYFDYQWEMANGETVCFEVVDIISFDAARMIKELQIIYDARQSANSIKRRNGPLQ